jgi:excisionase family DNA binding protein
MLITPEGRTLLSTTEAHQRSGLSRDHISLMIRRGQIEAMKIGNYWFIYEDSLDRYLASPRKPGPKPRSDDLVAAENTMPEKEGNREQ